MSDDPVVETISAILNGEDNFILLVQRPQLERIRDEIVALRSARNECERQFQEQVAEVSRLLCQLEAVKGIAGNERSLSEAIIQQARAAALEEAAQACDELYAGYHTANASDIPEQVWLDACDRAAAAIRALKEKPS